MEMLLVAAVPVAGIAIMLVTALMIAPADVRSAVWAKIFQAGNPQGAVSHGKMREAD